MTILTCLTIAIAGTSANAPAATHEATARFALVIGNNIASNSDVSDLRYADDDAVATHRLLLQAGVESVLLVTLDDDSSRVHAEMAGAPAPTRETVLAAWREIRAHIEQRAEDGYRTEFLFFYSGHGDVERGRGYISLTGSRFSRTDLSAILSESPATTNHVIVDACKSYYLVFDKGPGGTRVGFPTGFVERAASVNNTGFVLSTSSDRDSHEWERYQAGVFSHEVRSALRGAADANQDGSITYGEIGAFLVTANHSISNPRFRPDFTVRPPGGQPADLQTTLLTWSATTQQLVFDTPNLGHVYIEDLRGERVLDAHPEPSQELTLRIPEERPLFVREIREVEEHVIESAGNATLSMLTPVPVTLARKGALHVAFNFLFSEPFGSSRVQAFTDAYVAIQREPQMTHRGDPSWVFRQKIQVASGWTAVGALAVGTTLNGWALERYLAAGDAPQRRATRLNGTIRALNVAALVFYSLAGAAGSTWLTMQFFSDE